MDESIDKVCPFLSEQSVQNCLGEVCMMFVQGAAVPTCSLVKAPEQLNRKIDILSAQLQEVQVGLNMMNNRAEKG